MKPVIVNDGATLQVDLVPENDHDKAVLSMFEVGQTFRVGKANGYAPCRGGYYRPFDEPKSVGFVYLTTHPEPEK